MGQSVTSQRWERNTTNEETAGGVNFHYTCASWAKPYNSPAHSANSARECAELCASSSNCAAASWFSSMRKCYLTSSQIYTQYSGTSGALLLEKTRGSPDLPDDEPKGDCKQQIAADVAECQGEKAALVQTEREECQAAKTTLEQNTRERVENCESEKTAPPLYFDNDFARPGRWFYQIAYLASLLVKCWENVTRQ
ncbi:hypothetical protein ACLOAV_009907 [Pseudogymnoascus australis]